MVAGLRIRTQVAFATDYSRANAIRSPLGLWYWGRSKPLDSHAGGLVVLAREEPPTRWPAPGGSTCPGQPVAAPGGDQRGTRSVHRAPSMNHVLRRARRASMLSDRVGGSVVTSRCEGLAGRSRAEAIDSRRLNFKPAESTFEILTCGHVVRRPRHPRSRAWRNRLVSPSYSWTLSTSQSPSIAIVAPPTLCNFKTLIFEAQGTTRWDG